jgi:hypothetical protein
LLTEGVLTEVAPDGATPLGLAAEMEWQKLPYEVTRMHKDLLDPEVWRKIRSHLARVPLEELMGLTNGDSFDPAETLDDLS